MTFAAIDPFSGLPVEIVWLFVVEAIVVVSSICWIAVLFVRARRTGRRLPPAPAGSPADLLWVFVVPALDEETTIRDSVERLTRVEAANRVILVVDDGSTDGTPNALAGITDPDLVVLRRDLPDARQGKAAALNAAWRHVGMHVLREGRYADWPRERVVLTIVDADGRLDAEAPRFAAAWLEDEGVGGVQVRVRIYNRGRFLTWCQDVEFAIYGLLFQLGRTAWGTAGMGGNGQFNRLAALDAVASTEGPWRDRLTEDQDVGLRLLERGWRCVQEPRTSVAQQGLSSIRPLYRQRTRWSQGNLQAFSLLGAVLRAPLGIAARLDKVADLLIPAGQALIGVGFFTSLALWLFADVPFVPGAAVTILFFYALGFGGPLFGLLARAGPLNPRAIGRAVVLVHPYQVYSWLIFPVLARAAVRQLMGRGSWAKTAREPISPLAPDAGPGHVPSGT